MFPYSPSFKDISRAEYGVSVPDLYSTYSHFPLNNETQCYKRPKTQEGKIDSIAFGSLINLLLEDSGRH
jgi:hypothetical protein